MQAPEIYQLSTRLEGTLFIDKDKGRISFVEYGNDKQTRKRKEVVRVEHEWGKPNYRITAAGNVLTQPLSDEELQRFESALHILEQYGHKARLSISATNKAEKYPVLQALVDEQPYRLSVRSVDNYEMNTISLG